MPGALGIQVDAGSGPCAGGGSGNSRRRRQQRVTQIRRRGQTCQFCLSNLGCVGLPVQGCVCVVEHPWSKVVVSLSGLVQLGPRGVRVCASAPGAAPGWLSLRQYIGDGFRIFASIVLHTRGFWGSIPTEWQVGISQSEG